MAPRSASSRRRDERSRCGRGSCGSASSGPKPRSRSSSRWLAFVSELQTRDASVLFLKFAAIVSWGLSSLIEEEGRHSGPGTAQGEAAKRRSSPSIGVTNARRYYGRRQRRSRRRQRPATRWHAQFRDPGAAGERHRGARGSVAPHPGYRARRCQAAPLARPVSRDPVASETA